MSVEAALAATVEAAVLRVLDGHLPRLTLTRVEAAEVLGVSTGTVDAKVRDGSLATIAAGRITLVSVLVLAGWPVAPAPLSAPLAVVPGAAS